MSEQLEADKTKALTMAMAAVRARLPMIDVPHRLARSAVSDDGLDSTPVKGSTRSRGLSHFEAVFAHPALQGFRRWVLATRDAHGLYAKYGFAPLANPRHFMERHSPEASREPG